MANLKIREITSDEISKNEIKKYKFVDLTDIEKSRKRLVVKSNEIVNLTKFKQNVDAYKLLDVIFSFISKEDNNLKYKGKLAFNTKDYFRLIGINEKTSESYKYLVNIINGISSFALKTSKGNYKFYTLFAENEPAFIDINKGICYINLNKNIIKFLYFLNTSKKNEQIESRNTETKSRNTETKSRNTELKSRNIKNGNFTIYEVRERLNFKSKYSFRLHEILKANLFKKTIDFNLVDLRNMFNIDDNKYADNYDFKRKIINPAIEDINKYTNINVKYDEIIGGKKRVMGYKFYIEKEKQSEYLPRINKINKELDRNYK